MSLQLSFINWPLEQCFETRKIINKRKGKHTGKTNLEKKANGLNLNKNEEKLGLESHSFLITLSKLYLCISHSRDGSPMNNQILTFQTPVSVTLRELIGPTRRYKVWTQQYQLSSVIVATPIAVHQSFHRTRYLFHPVSRTFISSPFQRQPMCRFIGSP
nr:hypothetical protein B456_013G070500 [Gossypium raimondii]KJB79887.1 hypothetical protein B456_013G070500 [Gossypium raimondii]KJB79888.1 hypothetical protein B456_013G070500 [Gossypium raimondii]